jgi:CIC family chloride channel protein
MIFPKKWIAAQIAIADLFSQQLLQSKRIAIAEDCLIGLVSGLAAVLLGQGVGLLGGWRQHLAHILPLYLVVPWFKLVQSA